MTEPNEPTRSWTEPAESEEEQSPSWAEHEALHEAAAEDELDDFTEAASSGVGWPVAQPEVAVPEVAVPEVAVPEVAVPDAAEEIPDQSVDPALDLTMTDEPEEELVEEPEPVLALPDVPPALDLAPPSAHAATDARSGMGLVAGLVALVLLLGWLLGFVIWQFDRASGGGAAEQARGDALTAARNAARLVFSYDYHHLDQDFAAGKAVTTGEFRDEYARTTQKLVDDVALKYKAVVVADVSDAGVVSASANKALVLVFVNQQSTSTLAANEKITQSRVEMTMVRRNGTWLVEKIRAF